eukprot:TRINITY_DN9013_c0_g1_i1.p2 TRINITY_DN9013_c0_g1~~TRINITY_DN9013_c0_g1_i1.p2  ORF type:complete len:108 (-),score=11.99 TRINITY_DN9013_c0_g1_i1:70-393(-)
MTASLTGDDVSDQNDEGVWFGTPSGFDLVVREGDTVPGANPDVTFAEFEHVQFNDRGIIVIEARIEGPGIDEVNDRGVWVVPGRGLPLQKLFVESDAMFNGFVQAYH